MLGHILKALSQIIHKTLGAQQHNLMPLPNSIINKD
jgi:hypothetical protein